MVNERYDAAGERYEISPHTSAEPSEGYEEAIELVEAKAYLSEDVSEHYGDISEGSVKPLLVVLTTFLRVIEVFEG